MKPLSYPGMEDPVEPLEEARPKLQPLTYPGMAEETAFLDVVEEAITAGEALAQERIYERNRANAQRVEDEEAEQLRLARLQYSGTPYDPDQGPLGKAAGQGLSVLASGLKGGTTDFGSSVLRFGAVARKFLGAETPVDQMWETKAANAIQNFGDALMPEGPYDENFLNQLSAAGAGGVSYVGTSSATGRFASFVMAKKNMFAKGIQGVDQARKIGELVAKGTGASLGSILTTSGWYQEYKARWPEATDREAAAAAMYGVTMGPLELVGIGRSIGKMFTATEVKSLVRILGTRAAPEAIEEVAQEGIEGAVFEIVAGRIGRNEDYLSKAAWELLPADREDAISAITGALLGTFGGAIDNKSASAYQSLIDGMNEVFLEQDPQTGRWSIAEGKNVNTMTFSLLARRSGLGAREVEASIAILEEFVARNNELSGQQETVDDFLQRTFQSGFTLDKGWQDYKRGLVELLSRGWYLQGTDPSKAADVLLRLGSQDQAEFDGALREISGAVEQEILEGIKAIRPEVATRVVVPKSTRLKSPRGAATAAEMALDLTDGTMLAVAENADFATFVGVLGRHFFQYLPDQVVEEIAGQYGEDLHRVIQQKVRAQAGAQGEQYDTLAALPAGGQLLPGEEGEFVAATIRGQKIFMPKGEAFHGRMDQEVETKKLPREQSARGKGKQLWASASRETAKTFGDRIHRLVLKGGAKVFDPMDPENAKQVEDLAVEMGTASGQDIKTIETGLKTGYYHDWEQDIPTRWLRKNGYAANLQMESGKPAVRVLDARQIRTTPDLPVVAGDRAFRARLAGRFGNDFLRYVYEGKAPSRGSKVYFKEFSQLVRKVYGHVGKMPKGTPAPTKGDFPATVEQALSTMLRRDVDLAGGTLTLSGRPYTIHRVKLVEQEVQGKKTMVPVEFADRTKVQQERGNTYSVLILSGADLQLLGDIAGQKKVKDPKKAAKHQERVAKFKAWAATLQENKDYMVDVSFATSGLVMEKNGKVVDAEMLKSLGLRTSAKIPAIRPKFARRFSWSRQELEAATIGELAGLKRQHNIRGPKPDASWSQEKREKLIRLIEHKQEMRELYLKKQQLVDNASSWVNLALDAEQLAAAGPAAVRQLWNFYIKEQIDVVRTAGSGKTEEQADVARRAERAVALERRMVGEIAPKVRRFQQMTAADTIVGNRQARGFIFRRAAARENAQATAWLEQRTRVNGAIVTNFALVAEAERDRYDLVRVPVNRYRTRHKGVAIEYGVKEEAGAVPSIPQGIQDGTLTEVYLKDPPADLLKLMQKNKFQQDENGVWYRDTKISRPNPYKDYIEAEKAAGRWNPPVAVDRIMSQWREIVDITGTWAEQAGLKVYERDRTGKLLEMGLFKKAKGALVFPRQFTEEGLAILLANSDVGRRAFADAIRALNPELSQDFIMAQLEDLRTRRQSRHIGLEILRTFERMPTHVEIPTFGLGADIGGRHVVEVLESRPALVADSMVNGIARRIAFMHKDGGAFPQEREAIEQFVQSYTEHEPDFANEHGAAIKNLVRSLNGVPLEDSFLFTPGSPGYNVTQVVQLMMGLWRGRVLGRAALRNLFETSHTTRVYGGTLHWLKASAKVSKALAGGVKKSVMHPASHIVDPTVQDYFAGAMAERAVASGSITNIAALYLFRRHNMLEVAKGFAESFTRTQLNLVGTTGSIQLNELISDVTAREMLASIKRRGRATAFERHTLRDMRMDQAEIDAISAGQGTADMEQKFITKFVSSTQGTSMRQAERSAAQRTSLVNKNLFFWSYGRMIGDRTMQLADNALKDVLAARRGEGKKLDAVVSVARLANFGFGALLSGAGGTFLRQAVIYGVFPWEYFYDWDDEEKGGVDDDALAAFLLESMAGALLSGQIEGFIRHTKTEGPSEPLAILARTTAFSAWAQDLYDRLIVPKGEYATMGKLERAVMYMADFTTSPAVEYLGRGWVQLKQLAGFKALSTGLEDRNLRAAQAAYWSAMRAHAVDKVVVQRLEDSHKEFTRGINMIVQVLESQAMQIDSIQKGDFNKQTTAINEILAREGNELRRGLELAFGDARDPDSVKRALLGKRYLIGMQAENEAAIVPRLDEKTIDVLNKYDALLTGFANAMGAEK